MDIKKYINFSNVNIIAFADNNSNRWKKYLDEIEIIDPKEIINYEYDYIFIASEYFEEITNQLKNNVIHNDKILAYLKK